MIVALVAWLAGTPVARASDTTVIDPRRDVRANGLSDLERQAADIARVNATGGRFGVIVDVVFGGDADALLGQGRLRDATVALVLHRRAGALTVSTRGPDAAERSTRHVIRRRETFQFFALGVSGIQRIEIRVTIGGRIVDRATVRRPSSSNARACATLARRIDDLRDELAASVGSPDAERIVPVRGRAVDAWRDLGCRRRWWSSPAATSIGPGRPPSAPTRNWFPTSVSRSRSSSTATTSWSPKASRRRGLDGTQRLQSTVTAEGRYRLEIFKVRRTGDRDQRRVRRRRAAARADQELRLEGGRERERVDGARALAAQLAGDHRERPAAEADVVDEQARSGRRRAGDGELAADVRDLLGGVRHLALGRVVADALEHGMEREVRARPRAGRAKSGTSSPLRRDGTAVTHATGARQVLTVSAAAATSSSSKRPSRLPA